ncbi:MAG TPA: hypothetical protein VJ914_24055 [Pseudonocardiaceae bacterium]|nr:hypothetical protein [Pseudonocardiaceae bacterium]
MTGTAELADVLHALLYDKEFRDAFIMEGPQGASLDLTQSQRDALSAVDLDELVRTTSRVRSMVLRGHTEGNGGLRLSFAKTLAALGNETDLCARFLASPRFLPFREIPYGERGTSLEECFYEFLRERDVSAEILFLATHELFHALIRHVRSGALATFDVRVGLFRTNGRAWYGVLEHRAELCRRYDIQPAVDGLVVYAVGAKGVINGQCPPWLGDLLDLGDLAVLADKHGVALAELSQAAQRMAELGLC